METLRVLICPEDKTFEPLSIKLAKTNIFNNISMVIFVAPPIPVQWQRLLKSTKTDVISIKCNVSLIYLDSNSGRYVRNIGIITYDLTNVDINTIVIRQHPRVTIMSSISGMKEDHSVIQVMQVLYLICYFIMNNEVNHNTTYL